MGGEGEARAKVSTHVGCLRLKGWGVSMTKWVSITLHVLREVRRVTLHVVCAVWCRVGMVCCDVDKSLSLSNFSADLTKWETQCCRPLLSVGTPGVVWFCVPGGVLSGCGVGELRPLLSVVVWCCYLCPCTFLCIHVCVHVCMCAFPAPVSRCSCE